MFMIPAQKNPTIAAMPITSSGVSLATYARRNAPAEMATGLQPSAALRLRADQQHRRADHGADGGREQGVRDRSAPGGNAR